MSTVTTTGEKVTLFVNDISIQVEKGSYILEAIKSLGIQIPTLCHHKDLAPTGSCRLCVCEVEHKGKIRVVTTCNYPVKEDGIRVYTHTDKINKHRKIIAEMYLSRWPNVPVVQQIAQMCGVNQRRFANEFVDESEKACILCGRCVKACEEFSLEKILDFAGRGIKRYLDMPFSEVDPFCVGCSSCVHVCPTSAISIAEDPNHPIDPVKIRNAGMKVNAEMARLDDKQCRMRQVGTLNILAVMNAYDLLPVHNFKYGSHKDAHKIDHHVFKHKYFSQGKADGCWFGCSMSCAKVAEYFTLKTGPYKGQQVNVDGPEYETAAASANMGCFDPEFVLEFNFYCDTYGIDTISVGTTIAFVMECYEAGIIDKKVTGGLDLHFGACNEVLELLHQMAEGRGFGVDVGQGVRWLKQKWIKEYGADPKFLNDIGMEVKGLEYSEYVSKESLAQQGGYALAIKGPQHDEAWLIFMDMVNKQLPTFEDKAEALYYFPLWRTWFGLMGLCKLCWNDIVPEDNYKEAEPAKIPGHVRGYFEFFEGMTGIKLDEQKMLEQSARVYNLQKIICRMLGFGTRKDDMPPYRAMGPVTVEEYESRQDRYDKQLEELVGIDIQNKSTEEKIKILRQYREKVYNDMVDVVYKRRGWNKNGVPTVERLKELGIAIPELVKIIEKDQITE